MVTTQITLIRFYSILSRYDRSATRNLREKKIKNQPRSRESAEAEATAVQTTPTGSTELQNDRRDKSVYVSTSGF